MVSLLGLIYALMQLGPTCALILLYEAPVNDLSVSYHYFKLFTDLVFFPTQASAVTAENMTCLRTEPSPN